MSASEADHPPAAPSRRCRSAWHGARATNPNPPLFLSFSFSFPTDVLLSHRYMRTQSRLQMPGVVTHHSPTPPPTPPCPRLRRPCRTPTLEHPPDSRAAKSTRLWVRRLCCAQRWTNAWAPSRLPVAHALHATRSRAPGGALTRCLQIECCPLTQMQKCLARCLFTGTYFSFFPILCSPPIHGHLCVTWAIDALGC